LSGYWNYKTKNALHFYKRHFGSNAIRISNKIVADLKRIADLANRLKEFNSFHKDNEH